MSSGFDNDAHERATWERDAREAARRSDRAKKAEQQKKKKS